MFTATFEPDAPRAGQTVACDGGAVALGLCLPAV